MRAKLKSIMQKVPRAKLVGSGMGSTRKKLVLLIWSPAVKENSVKMPIVLVAGPLGRVAGRPRLVVATAESPAGGPAVTEKGSLNSERTVDPSILPL